MNLGIQGGLMKFILSAFVFISASAAFAADTYYLSEFVGSRVVNTRQCRSADSLCAQTSRVELTQNTKESFLMKEYDASGTLLSSKELKQELGGLISTTLGGLYPPAQSGFIGMWNLSETDSSGTLVRTEAVYFQKNSLGPSDEVKLSIQQWAPAQQPGQRDFKAESNYVLSKKP
jgi:hypothetical protein